MTTRTRVRTRSSNTPYADFDDALSPYT